MLHYVKQKIMIMIVQPQSNIKSHIRYVCAPRGRYIMWRTLFFIVCSSLLMISPLCPMACLHLTCHSSGCGTKLLEKNSSSEHIKINVIIDSDFYYIYNYHENRHKKH